MQKARHPGGFLELENSFDPGRGGRCRDSEWLPGPRFFEEREGQLEQRQSEALLESIALEEERFKLAGVSAIDALGRPADTAEPSEALLEKARELLASQRKARSAALDDLATLNSKFTQHRTALNQLSRSSRAYLDFIEERILWVRSAPPNPLPSLLAIPAHLVEVGEAAQQGRPIDELAAAARGRVRLCAGVGLLLVALLAGRGFLRRRLEESGRLVRSYRTDRFGLTIRALVQTALLALPLPLFLWTVGQLLSASESETGRAAANGLRAAAGIWFTLRGLRGLLIEKRVGQAHFRWSGKTCAALDRELRWFEPCAVLLSAAAITLDHQPVTKWSDSIGRAAFVLVMFALGWLGQRLLRAQRALHAGKALRGGLLGRTYRAWSLAASAVPLALVLLALSGYYYTALQFELRFRHSIALALGLVLVNALLLRWLSMTRRRLAVSQALEAKARREEQAELEGHAEPGGPPIDADQIDIPAVDAQTRRLFQHGRSPSRRSAFGLYGLWSDVLPALNMLQACCSSGRRSRSCDLPESSIDPIAHRAPEPKDGEDRGGAVRGLGRDAPAREDESATGDTAVVAASPTVDRNLRCSPAGLARRRVRKRARRTTASRCRKSCSRWRSSSRSSRSSRGGTFRALLEIAVLSPSSLSTPARGSRSPRSGRATRS